MKKYFKFSPKTNQYYMDYKGMPINFDKDDFERLTDEDIENIIKARTTQHPKQEPQEDIVPYEDGLELFRQGKERLRSRMDESFFEFYYSRK